MKHRATFVACFAASLLVVGLGAAMLITAADGPQPKWFKGNLHTHSLWSDGNDFPEMIADWYVTHGYDFLALSDHNTLSRGQKWMNLRDINRRGGLEAVDKYVKRFGEEWVERRGEGDKREVRLRPLDEFRTRVEKPGAFLLIEAEEITDHFEKRPIHINATNIQEVIKPQGGGSVQEVMEKNFAAIREQSKRTGKPILPHLNHPNFVWGVTAEEIAAVVGERFFEVHNGHPAVNQEGDETHASIERLWDIANTLRIAKLNAPPLYGLATDDSHSYHGTGGAANAMKRAEPGRGWVMVKAAKLDAESLIAAMTRGDFYASTGVELNVVRFENGAITLGIKPDDDAAFTTRFVGTLKGYDDKSEPVLDKEGKALAVTRRYSADVGKTLAEVKGVSASYKLTGEELYVRAIVFSSKPVANPTLKSQVKQAWTQPVGWEKWLEKEK